MQEDSTPEFLGIAALADSYSAMSEPASHGVCYEASACDAWLARRASLGRLCPIKVCSAASAPESISTPFVDASPAIRAPAQHTGRHAATVRLCSSVSFWALHKEHQCKQTLSVHASAC